MVEPILGTAINAGIYGCFLMEGTEFRLFSESFEGAEIYGSIQKLENKLENKVGGIIALESFKCFKIEDWLQIMVSR